MEIPYRTVREFEEKADRRERKQIQDFLKKAQGTDFHKNSRMLIFLCAARLRKDRQKFLTALFHSSYANIRRRCGRDFIFSRQP